MVLFCTNANILYFILFCYTEFLFFHRQAIGDIFKLLSVQYRIYEKIDRLVLHDEN